MDIGLQFDDDFFEKPREKEDKKTSDYAAKVCVPLWYMEPEALKTSSSEALVALKHQADFYYYSEDYIKANELYELCLKDTPAGNNTWKREFLENLSRCCLRLGNAEKALEWSLKLHEASVSPDQKVVSMNLLATVCHTLGKYKEELEALHCCIDAHKLCPEFWMRLGLCYAGLFKIDLPDYPLLSTNFESDEHEPCCDFRTKSLCLRHKSSDKDSTQTISSPESAIATSSSSSICTEICSSKEKDENSYTCASLCIETAESSGTTLKCEICTLGIQIVSSCLIHTRMLIDSGGPNIVGIQRDENIKEKIASSLKHMEVDQSFIDVASTMLGTDFLSGLQGSRDDLEAEQENIFGKLNADKIV